MVTDRFITGYDGALAIDGAELEFMTEPPGLGDLDSLEALLPAKQHCVTWGIVALGVGPNTPG
jgi:hypothetical protein